jgi:hypothetical protein
MLANTKTLIPGPTKTNIAGWLYDVFISTFVRTFYIPFRDLWPGRGAYSSAFEYSDGDPGGTGPGSNSSGRRLYFGLGSIGCAGEDTAGYGSAGYRWTTE